MRPDPSHTINFESFRSIVKVSAEIQPALTNVSLMPSIKVGGQFVPLESMEMAPSTHVSVLDINTPWSRSFLLVIPLSSEAKKRRPEGKSLVS